VIRTRDPHLGKVMLYQLSYSRNKRNIPSTLTVVVDFTDGWFPITCYECTIEQGPSQSTSGHLKLRYGCDPFEAEVPFSSAILPSVRSVSF